MEFEDIQINEDFLDGVSFDHIIEEPKIIKNNDTPDEIHNKIQTIMDNQISIIPSENNIIRYDSIKKLTGNDVIIHRKLFDEDGKINFTPILINNKLPIIPPNYPSQNISHILKQKPWETKPWEAKPKSKPLDTDYDSGNFKDKFSKYKQKYENLKNKIETSKSDTSKFDTINHKDFDISKISIGTPKNDINGGITFDLKYENMPLMFTSPMFSTQYLCSNKTKPENETSDMDMEMVD